MQPPVAWHDNHVSTLVPSSVGRWRAFNSSPRRSSVADRSAAMEFPPPPMPNILTPTNQKGKLESANRGMPPATNDQVQRARMPCQAAAPSHGNNGVVPRRTNGLGGLRREPSCRGPQSATAAAGAEDCAACHAWKATRRKWRRSRAARTSAAATRTCDVDLRRSSSALGIADDVAVLAVSPCGELHTVKSIRFRTVGRRPVKSSLCLGNKPAFSTSSL
mmetsp:Transcript_29842/g.86656  ORF Transcript_29842/g.86656 Transcript_29842/m.86656 type:complete len:219 (-) Transcript_29842:309-965(-)